MKSKKNTYLLLILSIIIWGTVGYKVYTNLNSKSDHLITETSFIDTTFSAQMDTFSLVENYEDPFLKRTNERNIQINNSNKPSTNKILKSTTTLNLQQIKSPWPELYFLGSIKNKSTKKVMVFLKINGNEYTLKEGEEVEKIKLLKVYNDSILAGFNKEKKIIKRVG